jgi:hypothetical protein
MLGIMMLYLLARRLLLLIKGTAIFEMYWSGLAALAGPGHFLTNLAGLRWLRLDNTQPRNPKKEVRNHCN